MNRRIITLPLIFLFLFFVSFYTHAFLLQKTGIKLPFNLKKMYLFHAVFSSVLCLNFVIFSRVDKVFQQISFIYLASIILNTSFLHNLLQAYLCERKSYKFTSNFFADSIVPFFVNRSLFCDKNSEYKQH